MAIAVINPEARALIQAASSNAGYGDITDVAAALADFKNANGIGNAGKKIGDMENKWKGGCGIDSADRPTPWKQHPVPTRSSEGDSDL